MPMEEIRIERPPQKEKPLPPEKLCKSCGQPLGIYDIALHRKLIDRYTDRFLCKNCIAEHFRMTPEDCDELIRHYKETGCALFN